MSSLVRYVRDLTLELGGEAFWFYSVFGRMAGVGWYYSFRRRDMNEAAQQITADRSRLRKMPLRCQVKQHLNNLRLGVWQY